VSRLAYFGNVDNGDYLNNFYNSLELTGKFDTGFLKHTLLIGGDYIRSDQRYTLAYPDTPGTNLYNPIHLAQPSTITDYETYHSSKPWFGLYGQDQIELPYNVHLLAGLRYDNATTDRDAQFSTTSAKIVRPTSEDDRISPRGGILWQPIPEVSLYGSYTENFGAVNGFTNGGKSTLPPQTAQQWESGVKTELFDGKFSATLSYYDLKKQNLVMADSLRVNRAIGEAESRGIEFDFTGEVLPGLKLIGAYAYTPFAKTLKDTESKGTIGKRLHNTPENIGNLWATYEFQNEDLRGLKFGAGVQAVGQRYIGYTEAMKTSGYATLNLMASQMWKVGNSRVTAQLNADNLLDKTYLGAVYSYGQGLYGAPRTFMGSVKIEY